MAQYSFNDSQLELHIIAEASANTARSFDIIALHGLGGTWDHSWTAKNRVSWLQDVVSVKFASSRIISVNCPDLLKRLGSERGNVSALISELVHNREINRRSHRPIIFIGHSLGGSLLKRLFVATHPSKEDRVDYQLLHESIRGFVFLGTPHKQLPVGDMDALWRALDRDSVTALDGRASDLEQAFEQVGHINEEFRRFGGEELPACCFYERQPTMVGLRDTFIVPKEQAAYISRPVSIIQLDLLHQDLGKMEDMNDPNCREVATALESLLGLAGDPEFGISRSRHQRGTCALNLLSLDGGGVRGLFTLIVLDKLMLEVNRRAPSSEFPKLPCDYFDLVGGTSTGGLLAIMLGRLRMDVPSCIRAYKKMSKEIFNRSGLLSFLNPVSDGIKAVIGDAWYDGERLKKSICEIVNERLSSRERESLEAAGLPIEDVRLVSTDMHTTRCFVTAICEGHHRAERIRSYLPAKPSMRNTSSYTVWEAGRATAAAPMYFPPINIQSHHYFDGGLSCNNPILEVVDEAREEFPDLDIDSIVSIGTGLGPRYEPTGNILNKMMGFAGRLTTTEDHDDEFMRRPEYESIRSARFRFQDDELGRIDLAAWDKMEDIERLSQEYLATSEIKKKIERCAERMLNTPRF